MKVLAKNNLGIEDFIKDICDEHTANAQEIVYNKIKERLEKQELAPEY